MGLRLLFTMRTADRSPKPNYLGRTVQSLVSQGVDARDIHVFPTDPDVAWMQPEFGDLPVIVHRPEKRRTANANGLAPIALLDEIPADWIVLSEDDLMWCADPLASMAAWLADHATPDRVMYRFFAFDSLRSAYSPWAWEISCVEQKGSQAVALRAADAWKFKAWAEAHVMNWRPKDAPFQAHPHDGFDKLLGYWALQAAPRASGLCSRPFFVRHLGVESSLHRFGRRMDPDFAGCAWRYPVRELVTHE